MKQLLGILVLGLLLSGCETITGPDPSLGEYGKFIEVQTFRHLGSSYRTTKIESITPKSITIFTRPWFVSLQEITNVAQYHCQKNNLDAVLQQPEKEIDWEYDKEATLYFNCK